MELLGGYGSVYNTVRPGEQPLGAVLIPGAFVIMSRLWGARKTEQSHSFIERAEGLLLLEQVQAMAPERGWGCYTEGSGGTVSSIIIGSVMSRM